MSTEVSSPSSALTVMTGICSSGRLLPTTRTVTVAVACPPCPSSATTSTARSSLVPAPAASTERMPSSPSISAEIPFDADFTDQAIVSRSPSLASRVNPFRSTVAASPSSVTSTVASRISGATLPAGATSIGIVSRELRAVSSPAVVPSLTSTVTDAPPT